MKRARTAVAIASALSLFSVCAAWVPAAMADDSNSPYIDQLKKTLPPVESSEGYVESIKGKLAPDNSTGYTEQLKNSPEVQSAQPSTGYTDEVKKTLAPVQEGGAIEAVKEGHSDLMFKKSLDIHDAFGIRVGMGASRDYTAPVIGAGGNFNTIYGTGWSPDVALYYEYQFLRDERWGSLGVFGMGSIAYFSGMGAFATPINFAGTNNQVTQSQTNLRYYEVPIIGGISYRMNLAKYVRPYLMLGPSVTGGSETRNDGKPTHYALSDGAWGAAGVAILMDWVSRPQDWDRYSDYSIKHTYLTVEYSGTYTLPSSPVIYSSSGLYVGFTFEY